MEREKLRKLKCSFFSTLTYFKGLKTSSHISKIPQSMALIKKEFFKKEEMEGFFVHTFPLSVGAVLKRELRMIFQFHFLSQKESGHFETNMNKEKLCGTDSSHGGKAGPSYLFFPTQQGPFGLQASLLLQVITVASFFPSNMYELNPGMLFTESFIKTI